MPLPKYHHDHIFHKYKLSTGRRHSCQPCNFLAMHIFMYVNDAEIMNETGYTQWIQLTFTVPMSYWWIYTLNKVKRVMKRMWRLSDHSSSIFITSTEKMCNNESSPTPFQSAKKIFLERLGKKYPSLELETRGKCDQPLQSEETNRAEAAGRWPESWTDHTQDESFNSKLTELIQRFRVKSQWSPNTI